MLYQKESLMQYGGVWARRFLFYSTSAQLCSDAGTGRAFLTLVARTCLVSGQVYLSTGLRGLGAHKRKAVAYGSLRQFGIELR
jgi:hypothetical protein